MATENKVLNGSGLGHLSSLIKEYVDEHSGGEGAKEVYIGTDTPTGTESIWINPEGGETTLSKVAYSNDYNDLDNLPTDLGKVDDVKVNGESVVTDKIANITIPDGPETYIKDASVADNKLTLTKQDDTTVEFEGGGSAPTNMVTTDTDQTITGTKTFGASNSTTPNKLYINGYSNKTLIGYANGYSNVFTINANADSYSQNPKMEFDTNKVDTNSGGIKINTKFWPLSDNSYDLGSNSSGTSKKRWKTVYAVNLSDGTTTKSLEQMIAQCPNPPTTDGNYVLKCTVSGGVATYSWEAN